MGFCRRCGEIVAGTHCKCGGTAVAPVVPWNHSNSKEDDQDKWSKTYVHVHKEDPASVTDSLSRERTSVATHTTGLTAHSSPVKRFPRPTASTLPASLVGYRVSTHIASTTSQLNRPPSPLKYSSTLPSPEADILPSPSSHNTTLSKVYGSVLQSKESLATHSCAICTSPFSPDATIYPDPNSNGTSRFLCYACFTTNGGSKGTCPTCSRPVLTLKSDGGFISADDKFWHKLCFNCSGCLKNIGDSPMVDLLGRPSCIECFDGCLKREPNTPKKKLPSRDNSPRIDRTSNIGGLNLNSRRGQSREGSPAIEELEQRLGIARSREGSPALEELSHRLSTIGRESGSRYSSSGTSPITKSIPLRYSDVSRESSPLLDRSHARPDSRLGTNTGPVQRREVTSARSRSSSVKYTSGSPSPIRHTTTTSPAPTQEAIEEMKQRFMKRLSYSPPDKPPSPVDFKTTVITTPMRLSRSPIPHSMGSTSNTSISHSVPSFPRTPPISPVPDLMSDFSDTTTQSSFSGPDSPLRDDEGSGDIFNVAKAFGRGYGSRYTRREFLDNLDGKIVEETNSELGTPTRSPMSMSDSRTTPTTTSKHLRKLTPSPSPMIKPTAINTPILKPADLIIPSSLSMEYSASTYCTKCKGNLFSLREGGKFVTVPGDKGKPEPYHTDCFICIMCGGNFRETDKGQAVFVKTNDGPCHVECAPPTNTISRNKSLDSMRTSLSSSTTSIAHSSISPLTSAPTYASSSRYDQPLHATTPPSTSLPRFGTRTVCPGCHKPVSLMERGVVPGPQGTRWHASCLVCGGKKEYPRGWRVGRGREEGKGEPGCGKKLDSAAKGGGDGGVWCRECLLLLGSRASPQVSPTRAPLAPAYTGSGKVMPQFTGTTMLAQQFTGLSGDTMLLRQLTGGGLSPTRSISPTKQLGGMRPRPKSVIGMRNSKSIDGGRGIFLVRQLTGARSEQAA